VVQVGLNGWRREVSLERKNGLSVHVNIYTVDGLTSLSSLSLWKLILPIATFHPSVQTLRTPIFISWQVPEWGSRSSWNSSTGPSGWLIPVVGSALPFPSQPRQRQYWPLIRQAHNCKMTTFVLALLRCDGGRSLCRCHAPSEDLARSPAWMLYMGNLKCLLPRSHQDIRRPSRTGDRK